MKRRMDNSGQNDSISISALILSPFAITGKEGIFIWFGNSKDSVSMLLRKKGHRPEDVVSCIIPMSNDKHLFHLAQWQKLAKNHCWCLGNRFLCEFLGSPQNTLLSKKPQGVLYGEFLLKLLWWKVLCSFWTFVRRGFFSAARHCFCASPAEILNKATHIRQGRFCHTFPQMFLCTLL